jgi:hypothetical protein
MCNQQEMNNKINPMKFSKSDLMISTIAMSLGWGLRGTIGGGSVGAMIPGAMIGLCLARLIKLPANQLASFTAFAALGFGIGGQETYGQNIGLLKSWDTAAWGMLGLTIKGAVWGLNAALMIWIGTQGDQLKPIQKWTTIALLTIFTVVGWNLVNQPKWIYFSDPLNKPREEIWFGQFLGPCIAGLYLFISQKNQNLLYFLAGGFIAGALGFGGGSLWLLMGLHLPEPYHKGPWWKMMEFSFGAILGLGFTLSSRFLKVPGNSQNQVRHDALIQKTKLETIIAGVLTVSFAMAGSYIWGHRLNFTLLLPFLIVILAILPEISWHLALSFTIIGFIRDVMMDIFQKNQIPLAHWQMLVLVVSVVSLVELTVRSPRFHLKSAFLILTWAAFGDYLVQFFFLHKEGVVVPTIFVLETLMVTALWLRCDHDVIPMLPAD